MTDRKIDIGDIVRAVNDVAEGAMTGVTALIAVLAASGKLSEADLRLLADVLTTKIPRDRLPNVHALFERLLPGYQSPAPPEQS